MNGRQGCSCAALLWTKRVLHLKSEASEAKRWAILCSVSEAVWVCNTLKTPLAVIQRSTNKSWLIVFAVWNQSALRSPLCNSNLPAYSLNPPLPIPAADTHKQTRSQNSERPDKQFQLRNCRRCNKEKSDRGRGHVGSTLSTAAAEVSFK